MPDWKGWELILCQLTAWISLSIDQKCQNRLNGSRARRLSEKPWELRRRISIIKCHLLTPILIKNSSSFRNSRVFPRPSLCFPSAHRGSSWTTPVGIEEERRCSISAGRSNVTFPNVPLHPVEPLTIKITNQKVKKRNSNGIIHVRRRRRKRRRRYCSSIIPFGNTRLSFDILVE